jgi:DNA/RNA-binding domain of Phe-tRNA-synthetase-like protein
MAERESAEPLQQDLPGEWEAAPEVGWLDPALDEEFPGLGLAYTTVSAGRGRSPEPLKEQLRELSNRFGGAQAINLRQQSIPWSYRVFFRHIGMDPDETPTPVEEVALNRMRDGSFKSRNRLDDALTLAVAEVGVALTAFDADTVEGRLGMRLAGEDESFEGRASPLIPGTILIADEKRPLAVLFRRTAEGHEVTRKTTRTTLVAIRVKGVPDVALEESLWLASSAMLV